MTLWEINNKIFDSSNNNNVWNSLTVYSWRLCAAFVQQIFDTLCVRCLCLSVYMICDWFLSSLCIWNVISYDISFIFFCIHTQVWLSFGILPVRYLVLLHFFRLDSTDLALYTYIHTYILSHVFFSKICTTFTIQCEKCLEVQNAVWRFFLFFFVLDICWRTIIIH